MFVAIKKLAMAIRIAITLSGALLLYTLRCGYDTRARSKLHGVFGCSFLRNIILNSVRQHSCFYYTR